MTFLDLSTSKGLSVHCWQVVPQVTVQAATAALLDTTFLTRSSNTVARLRLERTAFPILFSSLNIRGEAHMGALTVHLLVTQPLGTSRSASEERAQVEAPPVHAAECHPGPGPD